MRLHIDDPELADRPGASIAIRIRASATSRSGFDKVDRETTTSATRCSLTDPIPVASLTPTRTTTSR